MTDCEKLYYKAFNAITDAERLISQASALQKNTQQECESIITECGNDMPEP